MYVQYSIAYYSPKFHCLKRCVDKIHVYTSLYFIISHNHRPLHSFYIILSLH